MSKFNTSSSSSPSSSLTDNDCLSLESIFDNMVLDPFTPYAVMFKKTDSLEQYYHSLNKYCQDKQFNTGLRERCCVKDDNDRH